MFRESSWRIVWDPEGESPLVLLDFGDLMDSEMKAPMELLVATGKSDFALRSSPIARRNAKRRLEFGRRTQHPTAVASWQECFSAIKAAPWGMKRPLSVQPSGGPSRLFTAALLNSSHRPAFEDGLVESVHQYAFRVIPLS